MQSATALVSTPKLRWLVGCARQYYYYYYYYITTNSTFTMPELRYFHCSLIMMGLE
jgi:hypothetical protein